MPTRNINVEAVCPLINKAIVDVDMNNAYKFLSLLCLCEPCLYKTDLNQVKKFLILRHVFYCKKVMQL